MANLFFGKDWIESVKNIEGSWVSDVLENLNESGATYLNCISKWFVEFPGSNKQKNHLKASLRSSCNYDHLGAVNELSWWKFLTSRNIQLDPIPAGNGAKPDFIFKLEGNCIIFEVTTLNPSKDAHCREINFSQDKSVKRIIAKVVEEKIEQFKYGYNKKKPVVLVLFNYDEWTGFGTQFHRVIESGEFANQMPNELSCIIYLERFVLNGNSHLRKKSIVVTENPGACFPLPIEFKSKFSSITASGDWIICDVATGQGTSL